MVDTRDLVRRQFGAHADRYVTSADHAKGESLDRLLARSAPEPHWRVLDVATGGGHTALAVAPLVREVVATDLTPEMLHAAREFIESKGIRNVAFREADATALPFGDSEFDLVTCRIAPHHFPDVSQFVRETFRVLRRGGLAVVIDNVVPQERPAAEFINRFETIRDPSHNRAFSVPEWVGFFRIAGFVDTQLEYFRKVRDFDFWTGMMSVDAPTKAKMRAMLATAPSAARDALAMEERDGKLRLYFNELLIVGRRP